MTRFSALTPPSATASASRSLVQPGSTSHLPIPMGPVVFAPSTAELPVRLRLNEQGPSLCGKTLDWVEAVA